MLGNYSDRDKTIEIQFWADKIMDLGNLSVVVLIFEQLGKDKVNLIVVIFGIILYTSIILFTFNLKSKYVSQY